MRRQRSIQEMKVAAQLKAKDIKKDVIINDLQNDINTAKRTLQTMEVRYQSTVKEVKEKDEFIMNYIVSRAAGNEKDSIQSVFELYRASINDPKTAKEMFQEQKEKDQLLRELQGLRRRVGQ